MVAVLAPGRPQDAPAVTRLPLSRGPAPRSWVAQSYPNLTYFNEADRGGHFAAWEEPELFSSEVRGALSSLHQ
jgi:hypothetical protein